MAALEEQHLLADRALGYVELYGAYTETEARYRVDRLLGPVGPNGRRRPPGLLPRPGGHRLGVLRPGHPPALGDRARPGTHHPGQVEQAQPGRPGPEGHPLPRPPPGRLRPREHADRLQRGRLLRLAGLPPSGPGRAGGLRGRPGGRGALPPAPRPPGPGRLPPLLLPPLRGRPGRPAAGRRMGALPPPPPGQVVPGRIRPGAEAPGARSPDGPDHRSAGPGGRAPPAPVRLHRLRPARRVRRHVHRPARGAAAHRRGPCPGAGRVRRGRGAPAGGVHGLRRLGQRPAHAGGGRLPGGGQPRGQAGRHRPAPGLARRALAQGRGGQPTPPATRPGRPPRLARARSHQCGGAGRGGPAPRGGAPGGPVPASRAGPS